MIQLAERNVLVCLNGERRSPELVREARLSGIIARALTGGKTWIVSVSPESVRKAINDDEVVTFLDFTGEDFGARYDAEKTDEAIQVLNDLGIKHQRTDYLTLLNEIAKRRRR